MNTIDTATPTHARTLTAPQRLSLRAGWRKAFAAARAGSGPLSCSQHILYAYLRDRDWRRCITPCRCRRKLDNGHDRLAGLKRASAELQRLEFAIGRPGGDLRALIGSSPFFAPFSSLDPQALADAICRLAGETATGGAL